MGGGKRIIGVFQNESSQSHYAILSWREICAKCKWAGIIFHLYLLRDFTICWLPPSIFKEFSIINGGWTWLILRIMVGFWTLFSRKLLSPQLSLLHYPDKRQCAAGPVLPRGGGRRRAQEEHRHRHLRLRGPRGPGVLWLWETQLWDKQQQLRWQLEGQFSWHWPQHPPDGGDSIAN